MLRVGGFRDREILDREPGRVEQRDVARATAAVGLSHQHCAQVGDVVTSDDAGIDGAGERRIFFNIIVPQIWPTVITVFITVLIGVMKVFDVVYVTTNGAYNTDVIARRFYDELYTQGNNGYAATIVVILLIAVIPILIYQVRHFRAEEAAR